MGFAMNGLKRFDITAGVAVVRRICWHPVSVVPIVDCRVPQRRSRAFNTSLTMTGQRTAEK